MYQAPLKCLAGLITVFILMSSVVFSPAQTNLSYITNVWMPTACSVAVSGKYVYAGGGGNGLRIFDISTPGNPVDVGYVDRLGSCNAFVLSGQTIYRIEGDSPFYLTILSLANPTNPIAVGGIDGSFTQMKAAGTKVYLVGVTSTEGGLFIFDVSNSAHPAKLALFNYPPPTSTPSTMVVGEYAATVYYPIGCLVYSTDVNKRDTVAVPDGPFGVGDAIVSGNAVYCSGGLLRGIATSTFDVYDISDPSSPMLTYQSKNWGNGNVLNISGNYLYAIIEDGGYISMWDISSPLTAIGLSLSYLHTDYERSIAVTNNYAYVADFYGLSVYSLGTPASPPLSLASASGQLLCSWPTPNPAFGVQQNPDLNSTNWTTLTNASVVVGSQNQVTLPSPQGRMFYRLISQ